MTEQSRGEHIFRPHLSSTKRALLAGGSCRCKHGCICAVPNDQRGLVKGWSGADGLAPVVVPARSKHDALCEAEAGDTVSFKVKVEAKNVVVSINLKPHDKAKPPRTLLEPVKTGDKEGTVVVPEDGTVYLTLDNTYSYVNSKKVSYSLEIAESLCSAAT